ncbi:UNVERIFIED_CONTAM: hypothetical protein Sradi_3812200 [Sesamum radiatum]|uniref:Reverse transcriptase domain-containing protein n=1 Tax=Sesamum radiatum TaxID=300843 RepID=A0AAW2Q0M9_SESRA
MIFTQVQYDGEDDRESVASSNYIGNSEEDVAQTYHITLIEDGEVAEEDVEDAPVEFEKGVKAIVDELKKVNLGNTKDPWPIYISASLTQEEVEAYIALIHEFKDVFAWSYKKNTRIRPRGEVNKLIEADFIREVKYPIWISSIVPIRKMNGQIHVCIDFRGLNNACSKDDFLLPIVELMIDAATGHEALFFMDGSFGYNHIRMALTDEEMMEFRTLKGIYCYKVMPFWLKNTGATYQMAMQRIFDDMLHKNVKCYVDGLVVKSKKQKMNPSKCAFGVTFRKFLRFIACQRGIEIEQTKIDAILRMLKAYKER